MDFGCRDSKIDLGLIRIADLKKLIATDINTDSASISKMRIKHFLGESLDSSEKFVRIQNTETLIPLDSDSIDVAFSWSTFEHVSRPLESLQELKRVIKPNGYLIIQIFPMYYSSHGHHMWWDSNFPRLFIYQISSSLNLDLKIFLIQMSMGNHSLKLLSKR